jgi:ribA/ribD-fused uncharacterized protein
MGAGVRLYDPKIKAPAIRFYRATGEHGFLSNLFRCPVVFEGRVFTSSEAAYQYGKPKDRDVAEWIVSAPKPHLVSVAAHALLSFDVRSDWNEVKVDRMRRVLVAKFEQNPELKRKLLATGSAHLVEASKSDGFWGVGKSGKGQNMLGKLLMEVRA